VTRNEADKTTARERQRPGSTLLVETVVPIEVANLGSLLRDRCPDGEWNILHLAIDQPPMAAPPSFSHPIGARRRPASRVSVRIG
jgi:hypothetical protein